MTEKRKKRIFAIDPQLLPYEKEIERRIRLYSEKRKELVGRGGDITEFANGHNFFGFHRTEGGWVYREWAPAAERMYLTGDFCSWDIYACPMHKKEGGVFEVFVGDNRGLRVGQRVQAIVIKNGAILRRIPLYATRVVQDKETFLWCAELEDTFEPYGWTDDAFEMPDSPIIYECHVGMAQEKGEVGTFREFTDNVLPRIKRAGYNTLQIMAVMEHPYYASFGYQVSNFFAVSSRFGTSKDLKRLINTAHEMGIAVLLDVVHSHAVKNTNEGIFAFDGSEYQFFHTGERGEHSAWGTKLFDYGKNEVLHFLLSNLKYWLEVFHFDGFRFDGVTSMIYFDHGLGRVFGDYGSYFSPNVDVDALIYLGLANELVHTLKPSAITVAEDMSGMPGMCLPIRMGGIGFDYRLSMGVPDLFIKLIDRVRDEYWDMHKIWYELTSRRPKEKTVGYCESHDQALVGDKTIMFRLCDSEMYTHMSKLTPSLVIDRGIALHKMIRLITASLAGEGYLNFMGNEFGHPEWIDFPREGNGWSYHYCRRQWSLCDTPDLRYCELSEFDRDMITLIRSGGILKKRAVQRWIHQGDKVMIYSKGAYIFAFNFHPTVSFERYFIPSPVGEYEVALSSDDAKYGGHGRTDSSVLYRSSKQKNGKAGFFCYLPNRTAVVFKKRKKG